MDPTDPSAIHQAPSAQGIIVGRHEHMLRDITVYNHYKVCAPVCPNLVLSLTSFLRSYLHPSLPHMPLWVTHLCLPPVHLPHLWSPSWALPWWLFLPQCSHVFNLQPSTYATDRSRTAYVMNLLIGEAAQWVTASWEGESAVLDTYSTFINEMRKVFDHPVQGSEAASRFVVLQQGSKSAAAYSIEFHSRNWVEWVITKGILYEGLSDSLHGLR